MSIIRYTQKNLSTTYDYKSVFAVSDQQITNLLVRIMKSAPSGLDFLGAFIVVGRCPTLYRDGPSAQIGEDFSSFNNPIRNGTFSIIKPNLLSSL